MTVMSNVITKLLKKLSSSLYLYLYANIKRPTETDRTKPIHQIVSIQRAINMVSMQLTTYQICTIHVIHILPNINEN